MNESASVHPALEKSAADHRDEVANLVDQRGKPLEELLVVGPRLDFGEAVGDGKRTDPARRPLQRMAKPQSLGRGGVCDLIAHGKRLMHEKLEHLLLQRAVTECLPCKMGEIDRTGTWSRGPLAP